MPTYGDSKIKDMVRSVLPSTRRKQARYEKANANRVRRRNIRQSLNQAILEDEESDLDLDLADDVEDKDNSFEIHRVVRDRRSADKVKPLMKWAAASIRGQPDKRIAILRSMVPDNVIGEHAIGHIRGMEGFELNPLAYLRNQYSSSYYSDKVLSHDEMVTLLTKLMSETPWLHSHLNRWMMVNKLTGIDAIEEYVEKSFDKNAYKEARPSNAYYMDLSTYLIGYRDGGAEGVYSLKRCLSPYESSYPSPYRFPAPKEAPTLNPKPKLKGKSRDLLFNHNQILEPRKQMILPESIENLVRFSSIIQFWFH